MSVTATTGEKIILRRAVEFEFPQLTELEREYAGNDRQRWKRIVSMRLSLSGFPLSVIACTFGHTRSTAQRHIDQAKRDLHSLAESKGIKV